MTHLDLWREGGPVFWVIVFTGLASVTVFLERLLHLRRPRLQRLRQHKAHNRHRAMMLK